MDSTRPTRPKGLPGVQAHELEKETMIQPLERKRGNRWRHGLGGTPTHRVWAKMLARCYNPNEINFARYGGRGITVCQEWRDDFLTFLNDMGERHPGKSIERKNNLLGYSKDNCKWATGIEQGANKRNNRIFEWRGKTQTLSQWCRELKINYDITRQRIDRERWTTDRAFSTPTKSP